MVIKNKKAKFNYRLFDKFEAGIELKGAEVKAIKMGRGDISRSFAKFMGTDLFLLGANIPTNNPDLDPIRNRRLLLHKKELSSIMQEIKAKKLTLIPTKLYTKGRLIKAEIALAKTKRKFEKKKALKKKDVERDIERELKGIKRF